MINVPEANIENIFLYVADAVRWDSLAEPISDRGQTIKTVAASIHTPTSFSSIVSGLYPPQHNVRQFGDELDPALPTIFTKRNINTRFANTINEEFNENPKSESILNKTLQTEEADPGSLSHVEPPFIFVERGPGGHAPYGEYDGNAWEYYRDRVGVSETRYRREYKRSIKRDAKYFTSQLELLDDRNLLENTLVIYTSDHGELLGEKGCLGHNSPIHPSLVYVPTVLIHPSINCSTLSGIIRHVDLFPTICNLSGLNDPKTPGRDLTNESLPDQGACFYRKSLLPDVPLLSGELSFESLWDSSGGYVFSRTGSMNNALILAGKLLKSAKREYMRRHIREVASLYLSRRQMYGNPKMAESECKSFFDHVYDLPKSDVVRSSLENGAEERLQELGYLN
ncbi:sulfatase-like hydrolase/transferase [Haloarcula sp. Atlit-7R]|uniref:sulfatase-like hydrolase/transferase n=1 Tax=Haloarcula sp. Atlit-7R TaxID=2282125 RepID=UPI000EF15AFE|nr:sulfatase-like hydrolase/transferase [Haloarcula sp. Atlit-7R]RLM97578.1 hypothetical protein D3D01_07205 [Haloarcula sp. Atlit-7R]